MDNLLIVYGSTNGNTEDAARTIRKQFGGKGKVPMRNVADLEDASIFGEYERILLGSSTWGEGDLQDDWDDFIAKLDGVDLNGKKVAIFGMGDQDSYGHVYCNGMRLIYDKVMERGADVFGKWKDEGYEYEETESVIDGFFVGLALDADNQSDLTDERVNAWCEQLRGEMA